MHFSRFSFLAHHWLLCSGKYKQREIESGEKRNEIVYFRGSDVVFILHYDSLLNAGRFCSHQDSPHSLKEDMGETFRIEFQVGVMNESCDSCLDNHHCTCHTRIYIILVV